MAGKIIYLISDSTGELGERFTNALATQFPDDRIVLKKFNFVEDEAELKKAFSKIIDHGSVLFHTVLSRKLKKMIEAFGKTVNVPTFDLTGPPTDFMVKYLKVTPVWDIHSIHKIDDAYNMRIDAIEFAINHDDGVGGLTLKHADVILVGPSRTSKTPTSIYLAIKGYRVANVPLVPVVEVPEGFTRLKNDPRVFGFVIAPSKLQEVRLKRVAELGTNPKGYTDLDEIAKEIKWAGTLYEKYGWETIEITTRAIEETAAIIMKKIKKEK
ncbi:MAG: hypothetical protein AUJ71_01065 [Candidatus Omnitrophica bacterium CG1_02_49_16]|nr:MAG: hypothetical protein AUJ71_01065 [Candidatus Omnitrophica bacterium CG1_02_49_16]